MSTGVHQQPEGDASPLREAPRVLVAEDDLDLQDILVRTLGHDGYRVETVSSGLELFEHLGRSRAGGDLPALVVSDIRMPGLSGLQVLQKLKEWDVLLPVLLITAFPDEETLAEAERLGAVTVLEKPFEMDDLRTAVAYLIERPERVVALRRASSRGRDLQR